MSEQTYGGIDRATPKWWDPPPREYTEEELEILRRKLREAIDSFMKIPVDG
jgi:hypothetical protein